MSTQFSNQHFHHLQTREDLKRNTDFTIQNALFGAVKITKDENSAHNKYKGYGICFDAHSDFSIGSINNGKNVIIFGCGMSSRSYERNRVNDIYVLGRSDIQSVTTVRPTDLSGKTNKGTTHSAEKLYSTDFTARNKKFVLSLHYNGQNSYLFVNHK